jgi:RHS repeat-associated protein
VNTLGVRTGRTDALTRTTTWNLDNWNRLSSISYPNSSTRSLTYNEESQLLTMTDSNGTIGFDYDDDGRIIDETAGGNVYESYVWDDTGKLGLLSSVTDKANRTITYAYTNRNQLYTVTDGSDVTTYGYDNAGNETSITLPNTATVAKAYDDAGMLSSVTNKNSSNTVLSSFSYGYQDDDLKSGCTESNSDVVSWTYDGAHRLIEEARSGTHSYDVQYTLDGVGNRTSQYDGSTTTSFTLNSEDAVTATSGSFNNSYSYNANGEQTGRTIGGTAYTVGFDYDGQVTSIAQGGNTVSYAYDTLGRWFYRLDASSNITRYLWGPGGILNDYVNGNLGSSYTIGNQMIRKDGEYPMFDGLGHERTVTNSSQTVTGSITFDAFGQQAFSSGSSSNPYMFGNSSGYRNDGDAGLIHVGARFYDPQIGKFTSRDADMDQHPYAYCEHEPINYSDPTGAQCMCGCNGMKCHCGGWARQHPSGRIEQPVYQSPFRNPFKPAPPPPPSIPVYWHKIPGFGDGRGHFVIGTPDPNYSPWDPTPIVPPKFDQGTIYIIKDGKLVVIGHL